MPAVNVNDFSGIGSVAGGKNFNLNFTNCVNKVLIFYRVAAVGASPGPSQGLLPSSPNTGVAVQVQDAPSGSFQVTPLGSWRQINTSSSSYSVPMQVRYYQIASAVTSGPVSAAMTITTEYQ